MPDSCCHREVPGCGRNILREQETQVNYKIFTHGCITLMEDKLHNDVMPILIGYGAFGTILALIVLVNAVFAFSFSASINRKHMELAEARSFPGSTLNRTKYVDSPLPPSTPRFDHVRSYIGRENPQIYEDDHLDQWHGDSASTITKSRLELETDPVEREV